MPINPKRRPLAALAISAPNATQREICHNATQDHPQRRPMSAPAAWAACRGRRATRAFSAARCSPSLFAPSVRAHKGTRPPRPARRITTLTPPRESHTRTHPERTTPEPTQREPPQEPTQREPPHPRPLPRPFGCSASVAYGRLRRLFNATSAGTPRVSG